MDGTQSQMNNAAEPREIALPDLRELTNRLASDNARVNDYLETLMTGVDEVVESTAKKDWDEVRRLCRHIARSGSAFDLPLVSYAADRVANAVQDADELEIRRRVIKLVGACGRTRIGDPQPAEQTELADPIEPADQ